MKRILSLIITMIGCTIASTATPYSYKNAVVVWHGNVNNSGQAARGWWQSQIPWGQTTSWWYYAPPVSASLEMISVDKITRYWWGMNSIPLGYTYQGYGVGNTTKGSGDASSACYTLNQEIGEEWVGSDAMFRYTYRKMEWVLRVTLDRPWSATPPAGQLPPNPGGASVLEVVVYSMENYLVLGTYALTIPDGAVTVDFLIDHGNYSATVLNSWAGAAPGPVMQYYTTNYAPLYPSWTGWLPDI